MDDGSDDRFIYQSIWQNMQRENELINHRIGWAIFLSAGIFTATAVMTTVVVNTRAYAVLLAVFTLMTVLSWIGYVFSRRTRSAVAAAADQHDYLRHYFNDRKLDTKWPRPFGETIDRDRGKAASLIFPTLLVRVWLTAAIIEAAIALFFVFSLLEDVGFDAFLSQGFPVP